MNFCVGLPDRDTDCLSTFVAGALSELRSESNFFYAVEGYLHEYPERAVAVLARIDTIISTCHSSSQEA